MDVAMTTYRRRAVDAFGRLADDLGCQYRLTAAEHGYRVGGPTPGDVEYSTDDWDGSAAEADYPNPSDDDVSISDLADHYLFVPEPGDDGDTPPKSSFKGPLREGAGGPVNTNALLANIQALNGARGGFEDIDAATLRDGFDAAVDHLVAAGVYDDADDAPEMDIEATRLTAATQFDVGDTATWGDGDADVYGIVRDVATSGDDVFADRIDGDFALSPTEDNPGYLLETLEQTDDGWVPSGTMVGHREDTLEPWTPDGDIVEAADAALTASTVEGTVSIDLADSSLTAANSDPLTGIIWGAGDHDLALGGEPTPVHVPKDTVRPTFDALQEDIDAGDVTLGFDHPGPDSVAAQTGLVEIGVATDAALSADGHHIVLTDSELTNDRAVEAAADGAFSGLDWSIVADVAVRRDDSGDVVRTDSGRVVLDGTRIRRIDAVQDGAVDAASIERGTANLPDLADETAQVQAGVATRTERPAAVAALRASAAAISNTMQARNFDPDVDDDVPEAVQEQLNAAADIIDSQEDELEAAQAKAEGFESLLEAHGVDQDDYDSPTAAAQAVIDEQTEDMRREIAELEAELAQFDTDDVDARASDLKGNDPQDLRNTLNARKATAFDVEQKRQNKGRATAKDADVGRTNFAGGAGDGNADADDIALSAMDGRDRIEAEAKGQTPSEYVADAYGLHASQYDAADELHQDIMDQLGGGN